MSRDILSNRRAAAGLYVLPALAMLATSYLPVGTGWRTAVWTIALCVMGAACLANAARCGRVHCYLTGPFLLVMASVTVAYGIGDLGLGMQGWSEIGLVTLGGALILTSLPEMFLGKYWKQHGNGHPQT